MNSVIKNHDPDMLGLCLTSSVVIHNNFIKYFTVYNFKEGKIGKMPLTTYLALHA